MSSKRIAEVSPFSLPSHCVLCRCYCQVEPSFEKLCVDTCIFPNMFSFLQISLARNTLGPCVEITLLHCVACWTDSFSERTLQITGITLVDASSGQVHCSFSLQLEGTRGYSIIFLVLFAPTGSHRDFLFSETQFPPRIPTPGPTNSVSWSFFLFLLKYGFGIGFELFRNTDAQVVCSIPGKPEQGWQSSPGKIPWLPFRVTPLLSTHLLAQTTSLRPALQVLMDLERGSITLRPSATSTGWNFFFISAAIRVQKPPKSQSRWNPP